MPGDVSHQPPEDLESSEQDVSFSLFRSKESEPLQEGERELRQNWAYAPSALIDLPGQQSASPRAGDLEAVRPLTEALLATGITSVEHMSDPERRRQIMLKCTQVLSMHLEARGEDD